MTNGSANAERVASVRRRKPEARGARRADGGTEEQIPGRHRCSRSQRPADRDRPDMPVLRPRSRHDRRFARRRNKTDIAAPGWAFAGRHWAPPRWAKAHTADDKADRSGRRKSRHAEPDARHHRLEGKRIGDVNGQQAAARSPSDEVSQAFHQRHASTGPTGWRPIVGGTDRHVAVTLFTAQVLPDIKLAPKTANRVVAQ